MTQQDNGTATVKDKTKVILIEANPTLTGSIQTLRQVMCTKYVELSIGELPSLKA